MPVSDNWNIQLEMLNFTYQTLLPSNLTRQSLSNNRSHTLSRLEVSLVGAEEAGLYTCRPPGLQSVSIQVHVVQQEHQAGQCNVLNISLSSMKDESIF